MDTLTIPLMDVDFNPETDFTHISFNSETDQVELVSDEVDITTPGTYSTIYRVTHDKPDRDSHHSADKNALKTRGYEL